MNWNVALPIFFMAVMGLALLAYVVLDGYDLGVGILLPWASDADKDMMIASIGPFWDANETWLVLGVGVLLVAFPEAHGIILSALYLPVAVMLLGLTVRGVAFEFRAKVQAHRKPLWNRAFAVGSWTASMAQGYMLGSYITGFSTDVTAVAFSAGIALTLPAAYALLGAGWLLMKTDGALQQQAAEWGKRAVVPMAAALAAVSVVTPLVSRTVFDKWFSLPDFFALLPIPLMTLLALATLHHVLTRPRVIAAGYGWLVFAAMVLICSLAFTGLAYSLYPFIIMDRMTIAEAASATGSLGILAVGVAITLPAIIGYTVFVYRIFWGKARALSYA
jgi:cytochrome bd ubiquinol oxidase subunit II